MPARSPGKPPRPAKSAPPPRQRPARSPKPPAAAPGASKSGSTGESTAHHPGARPAEAAAEIDALRAAAAKMEGLLREKDDLLLLAQQQVATLDRRVEEAGKPRGAGNLRCPRCGGHMTEYEHDVVRADRCDSCHGVFFDNGELEAVLVHHDKEREANRKGWLSSLFGRG